jgi:hypothetical protein
LLIEPFANKNVNDCCYRVSTPIITANREADSGDKGTVPLGGDSIFKVG